MSGRDGPMPQTDASTGIHPSLFILLGRLWRTHRYDMPRRFRLSPHDAATLRDEAKDRVQEHDDGSFGFESDFGYLTFRTDEAVGIERFHAEGIP